MKPTIPGYTARLLTAALLLAMPFAYPASAQEEKKVTVEVKDGKVIVNGQERAVGDNGVFTFTDEDGEDVVVNMNRGRAGRMFAWAPGDLATDLAFDAERLQNVVERGLLREGFPMAGAPRFAFGRDEELRSMEREIRELVLRIRRSDDADRAQLQAELDAKLAEAFDYKQEAGRREAEEMAQRLEDLRGRLAEREAARAEVIARRKRELLGERDALDW